MASGVECNAANVPVRLDKGQGHRIAGHVIRYHSMSSSSSGASNPSSPETNTPHGNSPNKYAHDCGPHSTSSSPLTTPPTPESPSRHPLTLKAPSVRSPFDLRPDASACLPTGGTTALGRRVPVTRVSADLQSVGENAAPFSCTSAISLPKATPNGTVGFGSLPDQVHRKAVRRGFDFTIMVVGDSGLGKSTLIKSLFQNDELYDNRSEDGTSEKIAKTVEIDIKKLEIEEEGIRLRLTVVDTPGFNDAIDSTESWKSIENYIDAQFDHYFQDESGVSRKNIIDNRVHCCLYFISPYGHGLRPIDVKFMKKLHNKVNIVPVISKADILTKPELERIKLKVLKEINDNKIEIYSFPDDEDIEDSEQKMLRSTIPFAVIGADTIIEVAGKRIRGRRYPWGIVDVDNPEHCDFGKLRQMLISTHLQDLKDATRDLYENYRAKYIQEHVINMPINNKNSKVKCSESILAAKDTEIQRMQEQIEMMKSKLQNTSIGVNI